MKSVLKILILATVGTSLLALAFPQLLLWLALSWAGIKHLFFWQLITYIFIEPGPFSFNFFFNLGFNMYVLWLFGGALLIRSHTGAFLSLYLGSAFVSALAALAIPHAALAGSTNAVYAILVAWMMRNPDSKLLLFFTLPFKAQWLIIGLVAFTLFMNITGQNWAASVSLAASVLYAYLFSIIIFKELGPFRFLYSFERSILRLFEKRKHESYRHSKIYDIQSGDPVLSDDQFMDAMLEKISRLGQDSLTAAEKKRMKEISQRKK
jgi:membrane associated rhomboid family serine protease